MVTLGVDLGGTNIKVALVDETGAILQEASRPTNLPRPAEAVCDDIADLCRELMAGRDDVAGIVIQPLDDTVQSAIQQIVDAGVPYVAFDRIIEAVQDSAVANVKGDNEGIGAATALRFIDNGLQPGDKILIMPGDNSSVPEARNKGFKDYLLAHGWTEAQYNASVTSTAYTGWSRATGKQLFIEQVGLGTFNDTKYIFTHDDEIAMGILEALKSTELNDDQKAAFLDGSIVLGSSSGLNEIYSVLKGIHRNDYKAELAGLKDLFSVTYDPAMIEDAIDDMINFLSGKTHIIDVDVVDKDNVNDYVGFGDAVAKA